MNRSTAPFEVGHGRDMVVLVNGPQEVESCNWVVGGTLALGGFCVMSVGVVWLWDT